jgi:hypothetical protein
MSESHNNGDAAAGNPMSAAQNAAGGASNPSAGNDSAPGPGGNVALLSDPVDVIIDKLLR